MSARRRAPDIGRAWRICAAALCLTTTACSTAARYQALEARYLAEDKLRLETDIPDAPVTAARLAQSFERIAFRREDVEKIDASRPAPLSRWETDVVWRLDDDGASEQDLAEIERVIADVSRATGVTFRKAEGAGASPPPASMIILIGGADARRAFADGLEAGGLTTAAAAFRKWSRRAAFPCGGFARYRPDDPVGIVGALVAIKAETPPALRRACVHEEIAQAMGLPNDWTGARPSVFNDDQEFALLTRHDLLLLRILYDRRLSPGMTAETGMPIVRRIAAELAAETPSPSVVAEN